MDVMSTWTMLRCKCWDVSSVHLWEHSSPTFGNLKALAMQSIFTWHGKLSWSWNLQHCAWAWKKSEILNLYKCRQPSNYIHNGTTWVGKSNHSGKKLGLFVLYTTVLWTALSHSGNSVRFDWMGLFERH